MFPRVISNSPKNRAANHFVQIGTDIYGGCSSGVLAYTLPSNNYIAYCPLFFSDLPGLTGQCHAQDQATTALHEETHAPAVYSPGTEDNGYGYSAATRLSSSAAVLNADSYALYANGMFPDPLIVCIPSMC